MNELHRIWERQKQFNLHFMELGSMTLVQKESWTKDFILYTIDELMELARNTGWKSHRRHSEVRVLSNIREELMDAYKYLLGIMLIWDMTPEQFMEEFDRKSEVVEQRYAQEFSRPYVPRQYKGLAIVDIDGVLADYIQGFSAFIQQRTGVSMAPPHSYDLYTEFGKILGHERIYELKHQFREEGHKRKLEVIAGASAFMSGLESQGYYILLMSARPYKQYRRIMADTMDWLKDKCIPFHAILWDEHKEERVVRDYPMASFVIEDNLANALAIASKQIKVYLRDTIYNQGELTGWPITRFKTFEDLDILLGHRLGISHE